MGPVYRKRALIYGTKISMAAKNSIAPEALDTQLITYNTFSNRELLTQNFAYQRFTHHNFPLKKHPHTQQHPRPS